YHALKKQMDAERCFGQVIGMPDATKELVAWSATKDPLLPARLDRFVPSRFQDAKTIEPPEDIRGGKRNPTDTELYRLAEGASRISLAIRAALPPGEGASESAPLAREASDPSTKIEPDLDVAAYNLAMSEQELQAYDSVIDRANRAIEATRSKKPPDFT